MAKEWYKAVCDEHKELIDLFVDNPSRTALYLAEHDESIQTWLRLHHKCSLRIIHRDDELDQVFNAGYEKVRF